MSATRARTAKKTKVWPYDGFMGIDSSRDIVAMDTGKEQHLAFMSNCYADWRGQIVREPSGERFAGTRPIVHVSFYTPDLIVWVEQTGAGLDIVSQAGARIENAYPTGATVCSTVFNSASHYFSADEPSYIFDGESFSQNLSPSLNLNLRPAFATTVDRRLAIAGIAGRPTEIQLSRVDNAEVFAEDEDPGSENVLRAGRIDIKNQLGTPDKITGIAEFEAKRLIIFTQDRALIYRVGENIDEWGIDDSANIRVGTASHKSIQNAGTDLLFCSRSGIHSIRRSAENGLLAYSYSLSGKVEERYRQLYNSVSDPQDIEAVWDQDRGQYHVFFPNSGTGSIQRLTLSMGTSSLEPMPKFSCGSSFEATCGATLGGKLVFGSRGGAWSLLEKSESPPSENFHTPEAVIEFPYLWHGDTENVKQTDSIILRASGQAEVLIEGISENNIVFGSLVIEVDDTQDDNDFIGVPLFRQFERKWEHRYRAARYRITVRGGDGYFRMTGFAVRTREP